MMKKCRFMQIGLIAVLASGVLMMTPALSAAQQHGHTEHGDHGSHGNAAGHGQMSPYAGQEGRAIKGLSAKDIDDLRNGRGWGLAKAAELNGVPGPIHLLELADEIELSIAQRAKLTAVYEAMKKDAMDQGERLIAAETALDDAFKAGGVTEDRLAKLVNDIAVARGKLQFIHLSAHLETPDILSPHQIAKYNVLRGYASADCATPPAGHDPDMWRHHNPC